MTNLFLIALLSVLGSFLISKISWIVQSRNFTGYPDQRSPHKKETTMAGVTFCMNFCIYDKCY